MTRHKQIINQLFSAYQSLDHETMATCYHDSATFADIAFQLRGRKQIHAMWHMICENGIQVEVQSVEEHADEVRAQIVGTYTFSDTQRRVVNPIFCRFQFREGLIFDHLDSCDALNWARQAFGGLKGEIVGRIGLLRRYAARKKIQRFIAAHPEYA